MSTATQEPETAVTDDAHESNGMLTKRQQDMLDIDRRIISQNHNVREAHGRWMEAKDTLSRERKIYEEEQDRLSKLVDHLEDIESGKPIQQNLFNETAHPEAEGESDPSALAPMDDQSWFCTDCGRYAEPEDGITACPVTDCDGDLELLGYGGDPHVNEHGVFVAGVEELDVPTMPAGHETNLYVAQGAGGRWYAGFDTDGQHFPCDLSGGGYTTRNEAVIAIIGTIMEDADDDARTALQSFLDSFEN